MNNNSQIRNTNHGQISFSVPKWKQHQIKQIKFSQEEDFYRSTSYNLNDFKSQGEKYNLFISRPLSSLKQQPNQLSIRKQLKNLKDVSTAIFIAYFYEFMSRTMSFIQKNIHQIQNLHSNSKIKQTKQGEQKQQQPTNNKLQIKSQMLKQLKKKIYGINLCRIKQIPEKFTNFYKNDILKKIIFQYLTKCMRNISLIEILLENNQFLNFAISLISKSLLVQHQIIQKYDEQVLFFQEVQTFLSYFDQNSIDNQNITSKILPSQIFESPQNLHKNQSQKHNFIMFSCSKTQMKSLSTILKSQRSQLNTKIYLYRKQISSGYQKIEDQKEKNDNASQKYNKSKISPKSKVKIQSQKKVILKNEKGKGCWDSLSCWKFFS